MKGINQSEGVTATDVHSVTMFHRFHRIGRAVDADQLIAGMEAGLGHALDIAVMVMASIGNEKDALDGPEEGLHLGHQKVPPLVPTETTTAEEESHARSLAPPRREIPGAAA
jgi:hypothetical protein